MEVIIIIVLSLIVIECKRAISPQRLEKESHDAVNQIVGNRYIER